MKTAAVADAIADAVADAALRGLAACQQEIAATDPAIARGPAATAGVLDEHTVVQRADVGHRPTLYPAAK